MVPAFGLCGLGAVSSSLMSSDWALTTACALWRPRLVVRPSNSSTFPPLPRTVSLKTSSGESSGIVTSTVISFPASPPVTAVTL